MQRAECSIISLTSPIQEVEWRLWENENGKEAEGNAQEECSEAQEQKHDGQSC
jgi:hypothetical protein